MKTTTEIRLSADATTPFTSSPPRALIASPIWVRVWRAVLVLSLSSGKRSSRKACNCRVISGTEEISALSWLISVGITASTKATTTSTASSEITVVAAARLRPSRCSRSATGSRK